MVKSRRTLRDYRTAARATRDTSVHIAHLCTYKVLEAQVRNVECRTQHQTRSDYPHRIKLTRTSSSNSLQLRLRWTKLALACALSNGLIDAHACMPLALVRRTRRHTASATTNIGHRAQPHCGQSPTYRRARSAWCGMPHHAHGKRRRVQRVGGVERLTAQHRQQRIQSVPSEGLLSFRLAHKSRNSDTCPALKLTCT